VAAAAPVPLALFLAAERRIAGAPGLPLDDAWIHLHFARNLAEGAGFSYNPGVPVAGSTAPLWTLLLGAAFAVGGPWLATAKVLGVTTALAAGAATAWAARAWGATPILAAGGGLGLLWTGAMGWGALSGMEVGLASVLVAAALGLLARDRFWAATVLAALASLARPEAGLLLPLIVLGRRPPLARVVVAALSAATVVAPWVAFSLRTVGAPVPATAIAKVEGGLLGWLSGTPDPQAHLWLDRAGAFLREAVSWLAQTHPLLPWLLLPALAVAWHRCGCRLGVPGLVLLLQPLAMAWLAPYRGPAFQEGRYVIHLLPVAFVLLAVAASALRPRWQAWLAAGWLSGALLVLPSAAERYGWAVQNINAMQVHLGHWVAEHVPPGARLAVNDIGAIAWVSRRTVIDLMGLVSPEILPYRRQGERGVIRFLARVCPEYLIVFPRWFPELTARRPGLEPVYAVRLERNVVAGGPEMVVYRVRDCQL
jgi:hypothetical protein